MKSQKLLFFSFVAIFLLFEWGGYASAWTQPSLSIHGFGGWAYGKTDNENQYLIGNEDGNYDNVYFCLNISAMPAPRLSLHIQPDYTETNEGNEVELDYAFAEWYVSDKLILRAGKVKAPFMLYTEIYDVGTVRPFYTLASVVYDELAAESYKGVGATGAFYPAVEWEILYDVYGGKMELMSTPFVSFEQLHFSVIEMDISDMLGARITIHPPLDGLSFGVSSYLGDFAYHAAEADLQSDALDDYYLIIGASLEYLSERWWARTEYLTQQKSDKLDANLAYAEFAYKFFKEWQAALRYEFAYFNIKDSGVQLLPDSYFEKQDVTLGLNYWFNPNLVVKCAYHIVEGNRRANPEDLEDFISGLQNGTFDETTHLFSLGVQFSF